MSIGDEMTKGESAVSKALREAKEKRNSEVRESAENFVIQSMTALLANDKGVNVQANLYLNNAAFLDALRAIPEIILEEYRYGQGQDMGTGYRIKLKDHLR